MGRNSQKPQRNSEFNLTSVITPRHIFARMDPNWSAISHAINFRETREHLFQKLNQIALILLGQTWRTFSHDENLFTHVYVVRYSCICWMTSFSLNKFSPISRDDLIKGLKENGIDSRPVFPAISQYPIWGEKYIPKENSLFIGDNGINLPSGVCLKSCEVEYVCEVIEKLLVNS